MKRNFFFKFAIAVIIAIVLIKTITLLINGEQRARVADFNANGYGDVILTAKACLMAIDGMRGIPIWTSPFVLKEVAGSPIIGDFDGDGRMDVAAIDTEGLLHVGYCRLQKKNGYLSFFQTPEWVNLNIEMASYAPLSCFDCDGDGAEEILIGTEHGLVLVYDGVERRVKANVDVNLALNKLKGRFNENYQIRHAVSMADLNGDGNADMIVTTQQGDIVCLDLAEQKLEGKVRARELWWR